MLTQVIIGNAPVVVGIGILRVEADGLVILSYGLVQSPLVIKLSASYEVLLGFAQASAA